MARLPRAGCLALAACDSDATPKPTAGVAHPARTREVGGIAKMLAIATEQEACRAELPPPVEWSMSAA